MDTQTNANKRIFKDNFLYPEASELVYEATKEVWKAFRGAFKESVVERALRIAFEKRKLKIEEQKRIEIFFEDKKVGMYVPDFVINGIILIELKSKPFLTQEDMRQFWLYLKATSYKVGFLINFGSEQLEFRRRVYDSARKGSRRFA